MAPMDILIFETNVDTLKDEKKVKALFNGTSGIKSWSIDRQDEDKILRIEALDTSPKLIEGLLRNAGYHCLQLYY